MTESVCPQCRGPAAAPTPILHHMLCAYVGPAYDFPQHDDVCVCPKCRRVLTADGHDWEIVGDCARCDHCGAETHVMLVEAALASAR